MATLSTLEASTLYETLAALQIGSFNIKMEKSSRLILTCAKPIPLSLK